MVSVLNFKSAYIYNSSYKFLPFVACYLLFLTVPALTQVFAGNRICKAMEQDLSQLNTKISQNTTHNPRYFKLAQMQRQAGEDAKRYSCHSSLFRKGSASETCHYIIASQPRIEMELAKTTSQGATSQQRRMRHAIYQKMRVHNCRDSQNLDRIMNENRQATPRKRSNPTYKKLKSAPQIAKLQPAIIQDNFKKETERNEFMPVKAIFTTGNPLSTIPAVPNMKHTKAAKSAAPPVFIDLVDYVPDPTIRRVGPAYAPAQ